VLAVAGLFRVVSDHIPTVFNAIDKPQLAFRLNLLLALLMPLGFYFGAKFYSLPGVYFAWLVLFPAVSFYSLILLDQVVGISPIGYIANLRGPIVSTSLMSAFVWALLLFLGGIFDPVLLLALSVLGGAVVYTAAIALLYPDILKEFRAFGARHC